MIQFCTYTMYSPSVETRQHLAPPSHQLSRMLGLPHTLLQERGLSGRREGAREGGREGEREGGREGERERGREGGREGCGMNRMRK